jgi:hypothetical protein
MKNINKVSKLIFSTSLLILFFIALSGVNAADVHINPTNNTIANVVENQTNNGDKIYLDEGIYDSSHLNGSNGITINKTLTIQGKDPKTTIIDAQQLGRIFEITEGNSLTLINITLTNGLSTISTIFSYGGTVTLTNCILKNNAGTTAGSIFIRNGNAILNNCTLTNNTGEESGAARFEHTNVTIKNSNFIDNVATSFGGAIIIDAYDDNYIIATINNCTFTNNNATDFYGGAIGIGENVNITINNSTFNYNNAPYAGAILSYGNMTIINTIFNYNNASYGSAIWNFGNATINNSNFINNTNSSIYNSVIYEGQPIGLGINLIVLNSNFTDNDLAIYTDGNTTIQGCNIINNTAGILITNESTNTTINYNRIFNNTNYDLNNTGSNTNADYNWWGNNTPDLAKIIGVTLNNYFVMNVTNLTSLDSNGIVTFNYTFKLNNSDSFNATLLPYFTTDVYTNLTDGVVTSFDARNDTVFNVTVNTSGNIQYKFVTDNEIKTLEGTITIPNPIDPDDPVDPENPVDTDTHIDPVDPNDNNNQISNKPAASAAMKETGIPIIAILIILLSSLGLICRKK